MQAPDLTTKRGAWFALGLAAILLTLLAVGPASRLTISTHLEDLLPSDLEAAEEYRNVQDIFGSLERVFIVVRAAGATPADAERLAQGAEIVAGQLRELPGIAWVRSGLTAEDEDFLLGDVLPRAPLLVDLDDARLEALLAPENIRRRVQLIRDVIASPTGLFEADLYAADPLGFMDGSLPGEDELTVDPDSGAFLSASGNEALVVAATVHGGLDTALGRAIQARVEAAGLEAAAEAGSELEFLAVGGPLYAAHDEAAIKTDVTRSVGTSAVGVGALLVACFGGIVIPLAVFGAVAAGVLWTVAWISLTRGEISGIGISFASVLIGLGVDYGIHGAARFVQGRRTGEPAGPAMRSALRALGPAILVSVATTAGAFVVLSRARFGPVAELGLTVAVGIVSVLVASVALGAPVLVLASRAAAGGEGRVGVLWRSLGRLVEALVGLGVRRAGVFLVLAVVLSAGSLAGLGRLSFDADLRQLRPADGAANEAEAVLVSAFALGLDATRVVVRGDDLGQALDAAHRMRRTIDRHGAPGVAVSSPSDWILGEALERERIDRLAGERLQRAVSVLEEELEASGFAKAAFEPALSILHGVARGEAPAAIPLDALPDWLGEVLHVEADGAYAAVRIDAPTGLWTAGPPDDLVAAIREADPRASIASVPRLAVQLRALVGTELRRLGGWSTLVVLLVVLASFRGRPRPALLSLAPVVLGALWTLGLWGLLGVPLTLISVALAPLILGIGIDDGLHAMHGVATEGSVAASIRRSGRAMTLTTLTTCAGFGGLVFSSIPALRDAALLVSTGTLVCLLITLVGLPAIDGIAWRRSGSGRDGKRSQEPSR